MRAVNVGVLSLYVLAGLPAAPAAPRSKEKGDPAAASLQGTWDWDPATPQSDARPRVLLERVVIEGETLTFHYLAAGTRSTCSTKFKLDSKARPRWIDFVPIEGPNKAKAYLGLYQLADGKLRICYRGPESTRPKDFEDKSSGNEVTVFIGLVRPKADK